MKVLRRLLVAVFAMHVGTIALAGDGQKKAKDPMPVFRITMEVTQEGGGKKIPSIPVMANPGKETRLLLDGAREVRVHDGPEVVAGLAFRITVSSKPDGSLDVDACLSRTEIDKPITTAATRIRNIEVRQIRSVGTAESTTIELDDPQKTRIAFKVYPVLATRL
jgi:hypothetical protein